MIAPKTMLYHSKSRNAKKRRNKNRKMGVVEKACEVIIKMNLKM